eukprot:533021-Prymnesium_polylepis.1
MESVIRFFAIFGRSHFWISRLPRSRALSVGCACAVRRCLGKPGRHADGRSQGALKRRPGRPPGSRNV